MSDAGNAVDLSVDLFEASRDFRLELIESRFELIESRLESIESQLKVIESRFKVIESRLKVIESCLKVIESCVKVIKSSIESIESRIELIAPALGFLVECADPLKNRLNRRLSSHFVSHYFLPYRRELPRKENYYPHVAPQSTALSSTLLKCFVSKVHSRE